MWERLNADEREVEAGKRELRSKEGGKIRAQVDIWVGCGCGRGDSYRSGRQTSPDIGT